MFRLFLTTCTAAVIAVSAMAQTTTPRFFIERIEVRGVHRVSPDLVTAETLLRNETEYGEEDLRAALLP